MLIATLPYSNRGVVLGAKMRYDLSNRSIVIAIWWSCNIYGGIVIYAKLEHDINIRGIAIVLSDALH